MQDNRRGGGQRRDFNDRGGGHRRSFGGARQQRDYPDRGEGGGARDFPRERPYRSDRPYADRDRGAPRAGARPGGRGTDEGGMAIRLDPRRLSLLKQLAGEQGMRPGELVTQWVKDRLDAERGGAAPAATGGSTLATLSARVDELAQRLDDLARDGRRGQRAGAAARSGTDTAVPDPPDAGAAAAKTTTQAAPRRRRSLTSPAVAEPTGRRVPLHEEIASVISERGPMSASEIAQAILERGRYSPPRSDRPLDAATVNSRVSNPIYRSRFRRDEGKIGLSE